MSDAIRRGIRTVLAVLAAGAAGLGVLVVVGVLTADEAAAAGAVMTFLSGVITAGWNALEDRGTVPSVLKSAASSGANPITHDPPR